MATLLRSFFAFFFVLFSLVAAQDTEIPLVCNTGVQIIAVVGSNVANGTASYGLTKSFVRYVTGNITNSSSFSVNYNRFHNVSLAGLYFKQEVQEGMGAFYAALSNYTTACPNTPIVLHGYSEGAVVIGNILCGSSSPGFPPTAPLDASFANNIIAAIFYGDETRTVNQSFNYGTCNVNAPYLPRRNPSSCDLYAPVMQSYCNDDDIYCCGGVNASAPWPTKVDPHWLYPRDYDGDATQFVYSQYAKYQVILGSKKGISKSSTAMSKTTTLSTITKSTVSSSTSISTTITTKSKSSSSSTKSTTSSTSTKATTSTPSTTTTMTSSSFTTSTSPSSSTKTTTSSSSASSSTKSTISSSFTKSTISSSSSTSSTTTSSSASSTTPDFTSSSTTTTKSSSTSSISTPITSQSTSTSTTTTIPSFVPTTTTKPSSSSSSSTSSTKSFSTLTTSSKPPSLTTTSVSSSIIKRSTDITSLPTPITSTQMALVTSSSEATTSTSEATSSTNSTKKSKTRTRTRTRTKTKTKTKSATTTTTTA